MIVHIRLDERLIHGQITTAWSKVLDIDTIVCADDKAANDPISKKTLLLAKPAGLKVTVRGVEEAIDLVKDPRADKMKILFLVSNPKDAAAIVRAFDLKEINVANYVRKKGTDKVELTGSCKADAEDLKYFKQLAETCRVYCQMVPNSEVIELNQKIETF